MDHDVNTRMLQLERLLLSHGGTSVTLDAAGDLDQQGIIQALDGLGFDYRGCDQHGFAWEAEFRRRHRSDRPVVMGWATAYSEHAAVIEAAISALLAQDHPSTRRSGTPPPAQGESFRPSRPAPRRPRLVAPGLPSFIAPA